MRTTVIVLAAAASLLLGSASVASAETVSNGAATASTVGPWIKPTSCSQLPVEYQGLPPDQSAQLYVLDAVTRSDVGSHYLTSDDPRSGRVNVQVCGFQVEDTSKILLSFDVDGLTVDSAPFAWSPKPNTVRCVNKKNYNIREYSRKKCPMGWVKR